MNQFEENTNLETRVAAIEEYIAERKKQQISFPLDEESVEILNKFFIRYISNLDFTNFSGQVFRNLMIRYDKKTQVISGYTSLVHFRVDTSTDILTIGQDVVNLANGSFADDQQVVVQSTGLLPSPLIDAGIYYVVNANGDGTQIQLSDTLGGAPINITDVGTGEHYIYFFT